MLTWEQDLAYRRMLDLCYETERDLPGDRAKLYDLVGATTPKQCAAVDYVLIKYWKQRGGKGGSWHQQRVSKELARYKQTSTARASAANARWLAKKKRDAIASKAQMQMDLSPSPSPSTHKPPYPPYVSAVENTAPPAPPVNGGPSKFVHVERYGELIQVDLGKHKKLPNLDVMTGARAQQLADYLTHHGYPSKVVLKG
jgi:uncharacterized protein YdaU (DUF1376 family)